MQKLLTTLVQGVLVLAFVLVLLNMSACNTTEGVGRDVQAAGEALEDAAEDAND